MLSFECIQYLMPTIFGTLVLIINCEWSSMGPLTIIVFESVPVIIKLLLLYHFSPMLYMHLKF